MPVVTVQLWSGRTLEQKRALVSEITRAMVEHAGARSDALHVILQEVEPENWGLAGVIGPDRTDSVSTDAPSARPRILHGALRVADLERSERFYCDLLGFGIRERGAFRDGNPLVMLAGGLGLIEAGDGDSSTDHLAFEVAALAPLQAQIGAVGAEVVRGPMETAYGRSLYVRDPDGLEIELVERREGIS
ncbi:MAG: 2-hydroxymuconate tautomerase [Gaiellaceae bacterium]